MHRRANSRSFAEIFRSVRRTGAIVLAAVVAGCQSVPSAPGAPAAASTTIGSVIDGAWEGSLRSGRWSERDASWAWSDEPTRLRIVIKDGRAEIYVMDDENKSWRRVEKPFRMTSHRTNAVITAINDGRDNDDAWVETWMLSLTQINWRILQVLLNRHVNNEELARDDPNAFWWQFAYGNVELQQGAR